MRRVSVEVVGAIVKPLTKVVQLLREACVKRALTFIVWLQ